MKKLICLMLAVLLLAGCAPATYDGPTEEKSVPVEFIREHHQFPSGHVDTERIIYAYDIYGNLAQTIEFRNGKESERIDYTYDGRGNLLTETRYSLVGLFPRRTSSVEYTYDDLSRVTSERYSQDSQTVIEYRYDDQARTCTRLKNGEIQKITTYDEFGNVISEKTFNSGTDWHLVEWTRDDRGRVLTSHETNSEGYDRFTRCGYDDRGNTILWEINDNGQLEVQQMQYEYDDQGRMLAQCEVSGDSRAEVVRWEYLDENGSYRVWRDGIRSHIHRFDELGNLIENSHYLYETDQFGIREFTVYGTIQVPAKEETP